MTLAGHGDATWAAGLLAVCGPALGGVLLAEDAESAFVKAFTTAAQSHWPLLTVPSGITLEALTGALDLASTLALGKPVHAPGLLHRGTAAAILLRRAERLDPACAVALAASLDSQENVLLAVSTARADDEAVAPRLAERLALAVSDAAEAVWAAADIAAARARLPGVAIQERWMRECVAAAMSFGMASPRAPIQAVVAARASAALSGRSHVTEDDVVLAARLVYAHRALRLPEDEASEDQPQPPPPSEADDTQADSPQKQQAENAEVIVEAVKSAMPPGLLASLAAGLGRKGAGRNMKAAVQRKASGQRGRRTGSRRATSLARQRLDVLATLRTAAPWQPLRRKLGGKDRMVVSRDDFRVARIKQRNEATAIFAVDASGSTAFQRLAEAKGAVEAVLAECYVRRDKVALVSFRSKTAEVLLPPTRSLERAKRALAGMPGGGGTPMAAGLDQAYALAQQVRRAGGAPILILMTDGRANVTRAGEGNKVVATEETLAAARMLAADGIEAMVIDVSPEPQKHARALAEALQARYLPMPRAGGSDIARPVGQALRMLTA